MNFQNRSWWVTATFGFLRFSRQSVKYFSLLPRKTPSQDVCMTLLQSSQWFLESKNRPLPQLKPLQEHDSSNCGFPGNRHQAITHKNKLITFIFPWPLHSHKQPWNTRTTMTACEELRSAAVLKHRLRNTWASLRLPQGQTEALTSSRGELTADHIQSVIIAGITKPSGLSVVLFFTSNKFH